MSSLPSTSTSTKNAAIVAAGNALWSKVPKANAGLFALTYGSLVTELLKDYDGSIPDIHRQLDTMGYSMGVRSVDEFLAKSEQSDIVIPACTSLQETAHVLAKAGIRMMLGITVDVVAVTTTTTTTTSGGTTAVNTNSSVQSFSLVFQDNPLALFVELPEQYRDDDDDDGGLFYSILYCGMIRGALEQLNLKVTCTFVKDMLRGDNVNEIKVELQQVLADGAGDDYKEE